MTGYKINLPFKAGANNPVLVAMVYLWYTLHKIKAVTSYSFGLGEGSLDYRRWEEFPAISNIWGKLYIRTGKV